MGGGVEATQYWASSPNHPQLPLMSRHHVAASLSVLRSQEDVRLVWPLWHWIHPVLDVRRRGKATLNMSQILWL